MINYGENTSYFIDFYAKQKQADINEIIFKYVENVISKEDILKLKNQNIENSKKIKGEGLFTKSSDYRVSDVFFIQKNKLIKPYKNILNKFEEINNKYFQANITDIMKLQYTFYDENQHFNWHPDGCFTYEVVKENLKVSKKLSFRKLTMVLCLSDHTEYEGGEFLLMNPFTTPDRAISSFKMDAGEAIVFPAFLFHRINPVTSGVRKSIVLWGCGPKWK